jgi:hypothetical protein
VAREVFPSLGWARGVVERRNRCRGGAPRAWSLRQKFEGHRPLFMGLLAPDRSQEKVLVILSLTELDPTLAGEKSRRVNPVRLRVRYELGFRAAWIGDAGLRRECCCWAGLLGQMGR